MPFAAATIKTRTIHVGVTALARETGYSQPYVSKLLAQGYPADAIREKAALAEQRREMRVGVKAERERSENRRPVSSDAQYIGPR